MDVHQLRVFRTVVQTKSFSKAASLLYISQPMVTKTIKQLEDDLDIRLIERTSKYFLLTEAGHRLYELSGDVLHRFDDIGRELSDIREANTGSVTLAGPPLSLATYFPNLLKLMRATYPGIQISLLESGSKTTVDMVCDNRADIGISQMPIENPDVDVYPIVHDRCILLVNENHPFANEKKISISRLSGEKFIALGQGFVMYDTVQNICREFGFSPNIVFHTTLVSFAEHLVSLNEGIAILPRPLVDTYRPAGVCTVELEEYLPWDVAAVVSNKHYRSIATTRALELIFEYFADSDASASQYPPLSPL